MRSLRPKTIDNSSKTHGFTLVELLISLLLGTIIVGAVIGILMVYVFDFEQTDDITAARQRGEMVLAILENPVLHAGLGFPDSVDVFSTLDQSETSWDQAISFNSQNDEIYILYSVATDKYSAISDDFSKSDSIDISSSGLDLGIATVESNSNPQHWIVFPTANTPFELNSTSKATAELDGSGIIAQYDELHYVRSLEAKVVDGEFYVRENIDKTAGFQPRVDGIEQIYFENNNGILTVYVLARGNKQDSDFSAGTDVYGWPSADAPISNSGNYRLVTVRGSWRIRN